MSIVKFNNNPRQSLQSYENLSLGFPQPIEITKTSSGLDIKPLDGGGVGYGLGNAMRLGMDFSYSKVSNLFQSIISRFPSFDIPKTFAKEIHSKILSKDKFILSKQSCQMSEVGKFQSLPGSVDNIVVSNQYAYVTLSGNYQGLQIINIKDPSNPILIKTLKIPIFPKSAISGYYAYVVDGNNNFFVIDIKDPANAFILGQCSVNPGPKDVAMQGNYAYVVEGVGTAGIGGFQIIDIKNPSKPTIVGSLSIDGNVDNVAVLGNYAYLTHETYGKAFLDIINIKNPSNPVLVSSYEIKNSDVVFKIKVLDIYAYLATGSSGLQIINVANPANPVYAGFYNRTNTDFWDVDISNGNAYLANSKGLDVVDIENPENPNLIGQYNKTSTSYVAVSGNYSFVTSYNPSTRNQDFHVIKTIC